MKKARLHGPGLSHERTRKFIYGMALRRNCGRPYTGMMDIYEMTFPEGKRWKEKPSLQPSGEQG